MSLAKRLEEGIEPSIVSRPACDVVRASTRLDQEDADALHVLIYKRLDLTHADVSKVLHEEGIEISQTTIGRHRRGQCATCRK